MNTIKPVNQKPMIGFFKVYAYLHIILHIFIKELFELLTFKKNPVRFVIYLKRLLTALMAFSSNKVMKINGQYKLQLYLPAFPSKPFFHAIKKYDPKAKIVGPLTVVFSMTKACPYKCPHCYQRNDKGKDLDMNIMKSVIHDMQNMGVSMFDLEGGEPLVKFERLLDLLSAFDDRAEVWVNTTGHSLTEEKARRMKEAGVYGVVVSLHTPDEEAYDNFTKVPGSFQAAKTALTIFKNHGIVTAINFCPSADDIREGRVVKLFELAASLDVSLIQVIHAKPSGAWLYQKDEIFDSEELMKKLYDLNKKYNIDKDAINYPSILFQVMEEDCNHFGCTAGGIDRFYFNHTGEVQPCEFLNVSFGNVNDEPFNLIFGRMREYFQTPSSNWLCCSEAHSIGKAFKDNDVDISPLPREHTEKIVPNWNMGEPTKLYKRLGVYDK